MSQTCQCIPLDDPWHSCIVLSYHSLTTWPCIHLTPLKNSSRPVGSCSRISSQAMIFQLHIPWPVVFINIFIIYKIRNHLCKHLSTSRIIWFCNTYKSFVAAVVYSQQLQLYVLALHLPNCFKKFSKSFSCASSLLLVAYATLHSFWLLCLLFWNALTI